MTDSGVDSTTVPIKTTEPEKGAPPTLAEPASGAVAEMSGALPTSVKSPSATLPTQAPASTVTSGVNGTNDDSHESTIAKPAEDSTQAVGSAGDEDTEMKDAPQTEPTTATDPNGTPSGKKGMNGKRKSTGAVPEHKGKKLNKKKSIQKITQLDAKPGDYFFARLKSYPPWPSIICDEEMLPTILITTRPITTKQADGTYKEAYADDGKKVTDRTYPVMFLHTNEFAWIPNTDLTPLDPAECKDPTPKGKAKNLLAAYEVAAKGHDLSHFKDMLADHANALQEEEDRIAARDAEKAAKAAAKAEKKKSRKSEVKASKEDVEMADADADTKKGSKKRKKAADEDDEQTEKPPKTPKTTKIKLTTNKTPATSEKKAKEPKSAKAKSEKKKKAAAEDEAAETVEEPKPLDPVEERKAREKEVLFLRHKLQKGFISRDDTPREDEMPQMSNYIKKLEAYPDLEVAIIRATKINKVLKALVKLNTIPRDEEFQFRKRSVDLLSKWNKILGAEPTENTNGDKDKASPTTNGVHEDKEKQDIKAPEAKKTVSEQPKAEPVTATETAPKETSALPATTSDSTTEPKETVSKPAESAPAVEKAPESAEAAAVVQDVVKAME